MSASALLDVRAGEEQQVDGGGLRGAEGVEKNGCKRIEMLEILPKSKNKS